MLLTNQLCICYTQARRLLRLYLVEHIVSIGEISTRYSQNMHKPHTMNTILYTDLQLLKCKYESYINAYFGTYTLERKSITC